MTLTDLEWKDGDVVLTGNQPNLVTGTDVVRQDLLARLHCPPGAHWAYPELGVDLVQYVQGVADPLTLLALRQDVEIGCEQDTRIALASASVVQLDLKTVQVAATCTLGTGDTVQLSTLLGGVSG